MSSLKNQEVLVKKLRGILVVLIALAIFSLNTFGNSEEVKKEQKKVKCPKRVKVQVEKIKEVDFKEYKNFSATFNAETEVVTSTVSGTITDIRVYEDDLISKDWVIAVINNALKDEIENAEKEIKKWDTVLFKRTHWKVRSERAEKQAEEKINEAKLKLEEIKSKISDYIIKAPIEGKIKSLEVSKDTEVSESSIIAKIVNDKKMLAYITITESDKAMFSEGQKIPFKITGVEDVLYAEVTKVTENKIFLLINNQDKIIQDGLNVTLHVFKEEHKNVIVLSRKDIFTDKEGEFVYIISEKRAKKVYLKTGPEEKGKILILEGLSAGDEMIISEILSSKEGTLKERFECLKDNVKIKVMVKDLETGKFVKRKFKKKVKEAKEEKEIVEREKVIKKEEKVIKKKEEEKVKEEIIEKPVEKRIRKNSLDIGAGFGYCSMVDGTFKTVYSSGLFSVLLNISYNINYNYEIFLNVGYLNKKGIIEIVDEESTITMIPIYIGGKYLFKTNSKIKPYIGIAGVIFRVKEENIYNPDASFENAFGISLIGGVRLKISEKIDLFADLRYDFVKKSIENFDEKADLGGGKLHIGFVYKFSF